MEERAMHQDLKLPLYRIAGLLFVIIVLMLWPNSGDADASTQAPSPVFTLNQPTTNTRNEQWIDEWREEQKEQQRQQQRDREIERKATGSL
jgi:hypothetical protein